MGADQQLGVAVGRPEKVSTNISGLFHNSEVVQNQSTPVLVSEYLMSVDACRSLAVSNRYDGELLWKSLASLGRIVDCQFKSVFTISQEKAKFVVVSLLQWLPGKKL